MILTISCVNSRRATSRRISQLYNSQRGHQAALGQKEIESIESQTPKKAAQEKPGPPFYAPIKRLAELRSFAESSADTTGSTRD